MTFDLPTSSIDAEVESGLENNFLIVEAKKGLKQQRQIQQHEQQTFYPK